MAVEAAACLAVGAEQVLEHSRLGVGSTWTGRCQSETCLVALGGSAYQSVAVEPALPPQPDLWPAIAFESSQHCLAFLAGAVVSLGPAAFEPAVVVDPAVAAEAAEAAEA